MSQSSNYAGFWLRFVALIIDSIIIQTVQSLVIIPVLVMIGLTAFVPSGFDFSNISEDDALAMIPAILSMIYSMMFLSTLIQVLYYSLMEASKNQATLGKMALGLKVTDIDGNRLDFMKAFLRNIGKILSSMIMLIGYIMAGFTEKKQALHDILASTLVVKK